MNGWWDGLRHFKKSIHFKEKYMMKRPQMKSRTVCVMLKNDSFSRESLDKASMDGGVDVLRHFEKLIHFE